MISLNEVTKLCPTVGKIKYSTSLFYKEYSYKIQMDKKKKYQHDVMFWLGDHLGMDIVKSEHFKVVGNWNTSVFFKYDDTFGNFLTEFGTNIKQIHMPFSQDHLDTILGDEKVRVRPSLYFKVFRYKVKLKFLGYRFSKVENPTRLNIKQWLNEMYPVEDIKARMHQDTPTIFFKNEADLIMFKVAWNEDIDTIEKAILISEIKTGK